MDPFLSGMQSKKQGGNHGIWLSQLVDMCAKTVALLMLNGVGSAIHVVPGIQS